MLKIKYQKQIHLFKLDITALSFTQLKNTINNSFKRSKLPTQYMLLISHSCQNSIPIRSSLQFEQFKLQYIQDIKNKVYEVKKIRIEIQQMLEILQLSDDEEVDDLQAISSQKQQNEIEYYNYVQLLDQSHEHENDDINTLISIDDSQASNYKIDNSNQSKSSSFQIIIQTQKQMVQMIQEMINKCQEDIIASQIQHNIQEIIQSYQNGLSYDKICSLQQQLAVKKINHRKQQKITNVDQKMIEKSLQKYLPNFIKKLSEEVSKNVYKQLLKLKIPISCKQ